MAAHEKVNFLNLKSKEGVIHDNDWIIGMECEKTEYEKEDYSE